MLIGKTSEFLLKQTRAKAKMYEYDIPPKLHISVEKNVEDLMLIAIGLLGDISSAIINNDDEQIDSLKKQLRFASRYFDSFFHSRLYKNEDNYLLLLASAGYFFGEYYGSSTVLARRLDIQTLDLNANGLDKLVLWLLKCQYDNTPTLENEEQREIANLTRRYFVDGISFSDELLVNYREKIYKYGTARELLLGDIVIALIISKLKNSSLLLLPKYTQVDSDKWKDIILNSHFIKELWPSQRILGEQGIYKGRSGVIQLPTSAGKTKAISLIIRSAFLSNKTDMVIVVAPFRALCREISIDLVKDFIDDENIIVNEISDVLQVNQEVINLLEDKAEHKKNVIIVTPEKLIYLIRQNPEIIKSIGVLIFDEGHLFDDPNRGTVYELLVSTIVSYLEEDTQKLLISAVIPNASQINEWLNGKAGAVISSNSIQSSEKSIAFFDWDLSRNEKYGYLYFIDPENTDDQEFYVPRVVTQVKLNKFAKERKERYFPDVNFKTQETNNGDIAIYLTEKLCQNGGIAIFCGTKDTVVNIMTRTLEIEKRGYNINSIRNVCDNNELFKLRTLICKNYGEDNEYYLCASKGIFAHHSNVSNGIRVSVEYAMKVGLIKLVICTSTLAQGVNLPIKYLLISSAFQAGEKIRVRDFHNLIGRTGRAGFYTEGSIILTEDFVYNGSNNWKQAEYKKLLDADKSENCVSTLLNTIRKIEIDNGRGTIDPEYIINAYYEGEESFIEAIAQLQEEIEKSWPYDRVERVKNDLKKVIFNITCILKALESFILSISSEEDVVHDDELTEIAKTTLAYHLATEEEREELISLFITVNNNVSQLVKNKNKRLVLSKTLLGINDSIQMDHWVFENKAKLENVADIKSLLELIFPIIIKLNGYKKVNKFENPNNLLEVMFLWINGYTYKAILDYMNDNKIKIMKRKKYKDVIIDDVVELCEYCFGYQCSLLISALSEIIKDSYNISKTTKALNRISRRIKYGLPKEKDIILYELGFADRVIAQEISEPISNKANKMFIAHYLKMNSDEIQELLEDYPSYYTMILKQIVNRN